MSAPAASRAPRAARPRADRSPTAATSPAPVLPPLRRYQQPVFDDVTSPLLVLHWSRQIGKSETLARWAVRRLLDRPGRLVVVLSNSKDNGREFAAKCAQTARALQQMCESEDRDLDLEDWSFEIRVTVRGQVGRIKVLAANPRTARGFSGDLILDEFAFHADASAIWDAAEPILASNPDFLCRIASTGNGTGNLFYRFATSGVYPLSRVKRSDAWRDGVVIRSSITGQLITPEQAREEALDKSSYDQNYECQFAQAQGPLLSSALVSAAERAGCGEVCEGGWSEAARSRLQELGIVSGRLALGYDVARRRDFSVISVWERYGSEYFCRALCRLRGMSLPGQEGVVAEAMHLVGGRMQIALDATGIGEGPADYLARRFGGRVSPFHFSSTLPMTTELASNGERGGSAPMPLVLAARLLRLHLDGQVRYPADALLREDLAKPVRTLTSSGRPTIAASADADGHADHFWSFALACWMLSQDDVGAFHTPEDVDGVILGGGADRWLLRHQEVLA